MRRHPPNDTVLKISGYRHWSEDRRTAIQRDLRRVRRKRVVPYWLAYAILISAFSPIRLLAGNAASQPAHRESEVLFLSLSDPDLPQVSTLIDEAETQILENRDTPVHFTLEYLDPLWFRGDLSRKDNVLSFLQEKHQGQNIDLVIAIDEQLPPPSESVIARLFPKVLLLFSYVVPPDGVKGPTPQWGKAGVARKLNYLPTLQLALQQNPGTRRVIVIAGSSDAEKLEMNAAHTQFRSYEPNLEFQYWTDIQLAELESKLASAPADSIILFLDFRSDVNGDRFVPSRILPKIAKVAARPIYGTSAALVGNGIVGGSVADTRDVGRILGQKGALLLNGKKPETVGVEVGEFQHNVFDWRELHRWGIPANQLPPGSSVLFWELSPWEVYGWRIAGLSAAVVIEAVCIFLLLHNRKKLRRAEESLRMKERELFEAHRLAELVSWQWDPATDAFTWSEPLYSLSGFDLGPSTQPLQEMSQSFAAQDWKRLTQSMDDTLRTGEGYELELIAQRRDGTTVWIAMRGERVREVGRPETRLRGTIQDITERKHAEESRLKHGVIAQSLDGAITSQDLDGIITSWNPGARRIYGYSQEEAIGKSIAAIIPPELREEDTALRKKSHSGESVEQHETYRINKNGVRISVSSTIFPARDLTGRITGNYEIAQDITQRKQAFDRLKNSEEMFATAFRRNPVAVALTHAESNSYIDINEAFEQLSGYRRNELIGRSFPETILFCDPSERVRFVNQLRTQGGFRDVECKFLTKDGQTRVAQTWAKQIEIEGKPCTLLVALDITERRHVEDSLRESENRLRVMVDSAPVLMCLSGPDDLRTDFNREWLSFSGRRMEQELGNGWADNIHPEDLQSFHAISEAAFAVRQSFSMEYRLRRHDGQYRWMLHHGVPRFLENGGFAGYIGCCVDITEQKEAKTAQAELSGRLIQAQEQERTRIARELHDDVNQRLALLVNGLQELGHTSASRETCRHREQLVELASLTQEIALDIQHISHQLHSSKLHYLGLATAIRDLCHEFSTLQKIEIECIVRDVPQHLDENTSLALFRTAQESLHNIAKHSKARHAKVELAGNSNELLLRVSDDGIGFDPDEASTNRGLGRVSMQERLRLIGGRVSFWSRPSLGTQVEATVPIKLEPQRIA